MARKVSTAVSASGFAVPCASAPYDSPASEKPTMSAPPPLSRSRREGTKFLLMATSRRHVGGPFDRSDDARMRAAPAQIPGERILDVGLARLAVSGKEGGRLHDHAVDAVAALHRLLLDEGALQRLRIFQRAQAFEGDDLVAVTQ